MVHCRFISPLAKTIHGFSVFNSLLMILLGDFITTPEDKNLQHLNDNFNFEHLINELACFKISPSCIDLIITDIKSYFKNNYLKVTEISDFNKLTTVSLKSQTFQRFPEKQRLIKTIEHLMKIDSRRT